MHSPCTIQPAPACMLNATAVPVTAANHSPTATSRDTAFLSPCACAAAMRGVVRNTRKEKMYVASDVAREASDTAPSCCVPRCPKTAAGRKAGTHASTGCQHSVVAAAPLPGNNPSGVVDGCTTMPRTATPCFGYQLAVDSTRTSEV
jgi:hypothetical protein